MSMNLSCEVGGVEVPLQQTPTSVTNMCMVQPDGEVAWELTGQKARHAMFIYIEWLWGTLNGPYADSAEANIRRNAIESQVEALKKQMKKRSFVVRKT